MSLENNLILNSYSLFLLIMVYLYSLKHHTKDDYQYKIFIYMLKLTMFLLILDILSRFAGNSDTIFPFLNHMGNFLIFLCGPVLPSLWLLYVNCHVERVVRNDRNLIYLLAGINLINAVIIIISEFFGYIYFIDANNIYHRGPFFLISLAFIVFLLLFTFGFISINQHNINKKYYLPLLFFAVPPFLCIILQIFLPDTSLILNGTVFSLFVILLNIQNQSINTDYLTGINNRKKLEAYLAEKVKASSKHQTFSAILVDIDNFKSINDTFGHHIGDNALQTSANLLTSCLRSNDFIARFGGDEFFIVLDNSNRLDLEEILNRIKNCVKKHNESNTHPYNLEFSMGYALYDYSSGLRVQEFQREIDFLMYENKQTNKNNLQNFTSPL